MEAALSTAEAKLAELNSRIDALAAGQGQPPRAKILADLKALRVTLAKDTDAALKAAAERDALKAQVSAAQAENDKLNFQIGHLERACAGGGVALAEETPTKAKREKVLAALAQAEVTPKTRERLDKSIAAAGDAREARLAKLGAPAAGAAVLVEGPDGAQYPSTRRLYFDNMQQCSNRGVVLAVCTVEEKGVSKTVVILDQTVMHAQGGGQPTDEGEIRCGDVVFKVGMVRAVGGNLDSLICHFGAFEGGEFAKGAAVEVQIDADKRQLYARLHSAGHLVDDAMKLCGNPLAASLKPTKGYHFADGPYVEYKGSVPQPEREALAKVIEETLQKLIAKGSSVRVVDARYDELPKLCGEAFCEGPLMALVPKDRTTRVVIVHELGCPCGGTHVADIAEIGNIVISKIKVKKGNTQICYRLP